MILSYKIAELTTEPQQAVEIAKCFSAESGGYFAEIFARNGKRLIEGASGVVMLYELLRESEIPTSALTIRRTPHGRPCFANSELDFSVSHSGGLAMCALARGRVGVDIQQYREISEAAREKIARRMFGGNLDAYLKAPPEQQEAEFFICWSRLEAAAKRDDAAAWNAAVTDVESFRRGEYFCAIAK